MTATTQTLAEFLLEQIAADEAVAQNNDWLAFEYGVDSWGREQFSKRVLAVCEAHRRIVEAHPRSVALDYCETCFSGDFGRLDDPLHEDWPCPTLRALAAIYADHPDYREEWKP